MKHGLITFGNEESLGLSFVGGELIKESQEVKFFDGEEVWISDTISQWHPKFVMFSPMTTFYPQAITLAKNLKSRGMGMTTVFGGHHALACPDIIHEDAVDAVVVGPVRGSVDRLLRGDRGVIHTYPTTPSDMPRPARHQYYADIPRMGKRYRKFILSMLGCVWNCSYCSSSSGHIQQVFSPSEHRDYFLARRPIEDVIDEARQVMKYPTEEIEWVDDDIFSGKDSEAWLLDFVEAWTKNILKSDKVVTMYVSTTSHGANSTSDKVLESLKRCVNVVGMGIQAIRPESLRLFNRQWDNEAKMKAAYDRLTSYGYRVNLQAIVGLPVENPVEDALDTVMAMQRIGPGSIASVYPLMVYPGTEMQRYCQKNQIGLNVDCTGDTNSAIGSIYFDKDVWKKLRNICKLATLFVKYNISERWMRALINIDFDEETSKHLSMVRYYECVTDRLPTDGKAIFDKILSSMKLRY
jgi:radical SAM superfamily enzyme YgiQ (UPF0313 family)